MKIEPELESEYKTIQIMVQHYCKQKHNKTKLCPSCQDILNFAYLRLSRCPFKSKKPNCQDCTIHCYKGAKEKQKEMKKIMRTVGPHMLYLHPLMAFKHLLNKRRTKAQK